MKKIFTIILAMVLTVSITIPSLAMTEGLKDLEGSKYRVEIEKLVEDGTISGYVDGTFKPQNEITRGELARILAATLNLEEDKEAAEHFTDVTGKWNQGFVGALYRENIMVGIGQDKFGQDNDVTREELAVILLRIFELEEIANELALDIEFEDGGEVSSWAKNSVAFANKIGLMGRVENEDGSFNFLPKAFGERELVAKLVYELKYNSKVYDVNMETMKESMDIKKLKDGKNIEEVKDKNKIEELKDKKNPNDKKDLEEGSKPGEEAKKPEKEIPSYGEIVSKYKSQLSSLEGSVNGELSSLISSAMDEYKSGGTVSDILSRYTSLASELESSTDSEVSSILSSLSNELNSYGYDTSVISDLEAEYQDSKQDVRNSILP